MTTLFLLVLALGLAPLAAGLARLKPSGRPVRSYVHAGSVLLCALAFNLTFFWQELWLVIPKALTPGLNPILYHNNHGWTGDAAIAELLQGSGAAATLVSGFAFAGALALGRGSATWRLYFFWMAFQGLYQSLTQVAIGSLLPGNDVGRALAYLDVAAPGRALLLLLAVAGMALSGAWLARSYPLAVTEDAAPRPRAFGYAMLIVAMLSTILVVPFRAPRDIVEVALVPIIINLVGVGWLILGAASVRSGERRYDDQRPGIVGPALALVALLLFFQLVLRRGVAF